MREYELKILKAILRKHNNDIGLAAKKLDISVFNHLQDAEGRKRRLKTDCEYLPMSHEFTSIPPVFF